MSGTIKSKVQGTPIVNEKAGQETATLNEKSCFSLTNRQQRWISCNYSPQTSCTFLFLIPVHALCSPRESGGGQSADNVCGIFRNCVHTVALCGTWSAFSTSVSAQVKPGVCACCCLLLVKS